jgi:hypothetical protein
MSDCGCGSGSVYEPIKRKASKEESKILNKWIIDNLGRKLLIQDPIYDIYNDIIGYITKNPDGNVVRIFSINIKQILEE